MAGVRAMEQTGSQPAWPHDERSGVEPEVDYHGAWKAFAVRRNTALFLLYTWLPVSYGLFYYSRHYIHRPFASMAIISVWLVAALSAVWWAGGVPLPALPPTLRRARPPQRRYEPHARNLRQGVRELQADEVRDRLRQRKAERKAGGEKREVGSRCLYSEFSRSSPRLSLSLRRLYIHPNYCRTLTVPPSIVSVTPVITLPAAPMEESEVVTTCWPDWAFTCWDCPAASVICWSPAFKLSVPLVWFVTVNLTVLAAFTFLVVWVVVASWARTVAAGTRKANGCC